MTLEFRGCISEGEKSANMAVIFINVSNAPLTKVNTFFECKMRFLTDLCLLAKTLVAGHDHGRFRPGSDLSSIISTLVEFDTVSPNS